MSRSRSRVRVRFALFAVLALALAMSGCIAIVPAPRAEGSRSRRVEQSPPPQRRADQIGPFRNNQAYRLAPGVYVGRLVINANKVSLVGAGVERTFLEGGVVINGNHCLLGNLTIRGAVVINGNNNDLRAAVIRGRVQANGKHNRW